MLPFHFICIHFYNCVNLSDQLTNHLRASLRCPSSIIHSFQTNPLSHHYKEPPSDNPVSYHPNARINSSSITIYSSYTYIAYLIKDLAPNACISVPHFTIIIVSYIFYTNTHSIFSNKIHEDFKQNTSSKKDDNKQWLPCPGLLHPRQ